MNRSVLWVWNAGAGPAAEQIGLDRAQWWAAHHNGVASLRWFRSEPAAWVGRHDDAERAVRMSYCRAHGIEVVRRLTGGESWWVDSGQLCWTLCAPVGARTGTRLADVTAWLQSAVTAALRTAGLDAAFTPPSELSAGGRRLGALFVLVEDGVLLATGAVFETLDVERYLKVLRLPREKLSPEGLLSARRGVATLTECLPDRHARGRVTAALEAALAHALGRMPRRAPARDWYPVTRAGDRVTAAGEPHEPPRDTVVAASVGATLYGALWVDPVHELVRRLALRGSFLVDPPDAPARACAAVEGVPVHRLADAFEQALWTEPAQWIGCCEDDVIGVVRQLADRDAQRRTFGLSGGQANALMLHGRGARLDAMTVAREAEVLLLPYCAKPLWCKWRWREGCPQCGRCDIGTAYGIGAAAGMRVITIQNYEHLLATFRDLEAAGVESYVGMCCHHFFIKRQRAFREARLDGLLIDICGSNCYELGQEDAAYRGTFAAQSQIDPVVLEKVLSGRLRATRRSRELVVESAHLERPSEDAP